MFATVKDLFHDLDLGMQPISVIFPYIPIAAHRQRDKYLTPSNLYFPDDCLITLMV